MKTDTEIDGAAGAVCAAFDRFTLAEREELKREMEAFDVADLRGHRERLVRRLQGRVHGILMAPMWKFNAYKVELQIKPLLRGKRPWVLYPGSRR